MEKFILIFVMTMTMVIVGSDVSFAQGTISRSNKKTNIHNRDASNNKKQEKSSVSRSEMYYKGLDEYNNKNYAEAFKYFNKTAKMGGYADSDYILAEMYYYGIGVLQNYSEALKWYRKTAKMGYADSEFKIGEMYYNGKGVTKDYSEALKWYKKAANQGHRIAQEKLGAMYYNGYGVSKNVSEAKIWWEKAAAQGQENAIQNLKNFFGINY